MPPEERRAQAQLALQELDRLTRLFQDILDMARIDAAAVNPERQWVSPADVVDAAVAHVAPALAEHDAADRRRRPSTEIQVDPRLTSTALAHVLENAGRYSPDGAAISVRAWTESDGAHFVVRDHGPGSTRRTWITCSSRSIAARRQGTPPERDSGSRSRAGCWRPKAAGSGARTCLTAAPSSRSWCHHPSACSDAQAS